jgi:hypothetical protein
VRLPAWLDREERLVGGLTIATVAVILAGYLLALMLGATVWLCLLLSGLTLLAAALLFFPARARLHELRQPLPVSFAIMFLILAFGLGFLFVRAVEVAPSGWLAHYNNTWSDWSFHASYATTFVYGQNLPPQNPLFALTPFRYPFAPDFGSALLIAGGWSIPAALIWPGWAMTVLALAGLVLWGKRLTGGIGAGALAVTLTLLGGGLGFWFFFGDAGHLGFFNALAHIPRQYDRFDPPVNIQWYNPILSYYLPQRSFVFGAAIVITVLLLVTRAVQATPLFHWRETLSAIRESGGRIRPGGEAIIFLLAGTLCGTLPWFHVHGLLVLGIVMLAWAVLFPRPAWLLFFLALFLLAAPRLLMAIPGDPGAPASLHYPRFQLGWVSGADNVALFWLKNTGAFWPLLLLSLLSSAALGVRSRLLLAPFSLVFLLANLVIFQPWDWDNSKLLVFWYMGSAVAVGALLIKLGRLHPAATVAAAAVWLSLVASGVLSLLQYLPPQGPTYVWFTNEELRLAAQVRQSTPPHAIFLTGDWVINPVADLAGRSVLMSYPGWLWSYGIDYSKRQADINQIYAGDPQALDLLHHYHVQYVVIGPYELSHAHAALSYFDSSFALLLATENYRIFKVPPG